MKLSQFLYLFSVILFCTPLTLLAWKYDFKTIKKNVLTLFYAALVSLVIVPFEYFALKWKAWEYYPESVLPLRLGGQIEAYFFMIGVVIMVGSLSLVLAGTIDKRSKRR